MTRIHEPTGLAAALEALATRDGDIAHALKLHGMPAPRRREPGFATLVDIVVAQQVSTRAAATVRGRIEVAAGGRVTPANLLELGEAGLRAAGLSGRKAQYVLGLAIAVERGELDIDGLAELDDEEVVETITSQRGLGQWSADIYMLFALGRPDIMPAGDLALQVGYRMLRKSNTKPDTALLLAASEEWRPLRGAAAILLWHIYGKATLDP